jgi:hypothetical protein
MPSTSIHSRYSLTPLVNTVKQAYDISPGKEPVGVYLVVVRSRRLERATARRHVSVMRLDKQPQPHLNWTGRVEKDFFQLRRDRAVPCRTASPPTPWQPLLSSHATHNASAWRVNKVERAYCISPGRPAFVACCILSTEMTTNKEQCEM